MNGVTNEEVLRAIDSSRTAITMQVGGLKAAVDHLSEAIQAHEARISALEEVTGNHTRPATGTAAVVASTSALVQPVASDVRELLIAYNRDKAMREAKSQISLESAAAEAQEIERAKRRKDTVTWLLGALFVAANILTIVRGLR